MRQRPALTAVSPGAGISASPTGIMKMITVRIRMLRVRNADVILTQAVRMDACIGTLRR